MYRYSELEAPSLLDIYKALKFTYTKERHRAVIAQDMALLLQRPDLLRPVNSLRITPENLGSFACPDDLTTVDKAVTIPLCQEGKSHATDD